MNGDACFKITPHSGIVNQNPKDSNINWKYNHKLSNKKNSQYVISYW